MYHGADPVLAAMLRVVGARDVAADEGGEGVEDGEGGEHGAAAIQRVIVVERHAQQRHQERQDQQVRARANHCATSVRR